MAKDKKNTKASSRRARSIRPDPDHTHVLPHHLHTNATEPGLNNSAQIQNPSYSTHSACECYWTESQLNILLLKNLELMYNEVLYKLVKAGNDEKDALKAILRNGYCHSESSMNVLNNIHHNSEAYLKNGITLGPEQGFTDLNRLGEYSLTVLITSLQNLKPNLSKTDAMWCLLMSNLNIANASSLDLSLIPPSPNEKWECVEVGAFPSLCPFHADLTFGKGFSEFSNELPKKLAFSPSMINLLKRNVEAFAANFREKIKENSINVEEGQNPKTQDRVNSNLLSKFRALNLEESIEKGSLDKKDEMILTTLQEIKELEKQVSEKKEWAHKTAIQAAKKLVKDLTELKKLRLEKEELKKPVIDETTTKKLEEMEINLRRESAKLDEENIKIKKLEIENAEIKSEMEGYKLSASESVNSCLKIEKKEKKYLKRILAWEKQKSLIQDNISNEKEKIKDIKQQIIQVEAASKDIEVKRKQTQKMKEQGLVKFEEEKRLKELAEENSKKTVLTVKDNIEMEFKRNKDDIKRLEEELSRLVVASKEEEDFTVKSLLNETEGKSVIKCYDRECVICGKDEASIVFLPCTCQVVCGKCNERYVKNVCVRCGVFVEKKIFIFGV